MNKLDQLLAAVIEAEAHVVRQQLAGKHEQDKADAIEWVTKWRGLVKWARTQERQRPITWSEKIERVNK